jgi:hypothetical protein
MRSDADGILLLLARMCTTPETVIITMDVEPDTAQVHVSIEEDPVKSLKLIDG